jgi:uncharacterized membrane protein
MNLTVLHPYVDHFSIALVLIGILAQFRAKLNTPQPTDSIGWGALLVGLACWLISILTGYAAQAKALLDPSIQQLLNYHQVLSLVSFATLGAAILLRVLARSRFHEPTEGAALRGAYFAILSVTLMLVMGTVYLGTQLVYAHGLGVKPYQELMLSPDIIAAPQPGTHAAPADSTH